MSTREKAVSLLLELPEQAVETVFAFMQDLAARQTPRPAAQDAFGIAHKYANPVLMEQERGAFERAMAEKHDAG